jgi:hypothetical protein
MLLPAGWSLAGSSGDDAAQRPAIGTASLLEWKWASLPASPFSFACVLNTPQTPLGEKQLSALVTVGPAETPLQATVKPDPLIVPQLVVHSADFDRNLRISLLELTRVIEIYNTRNGSSRTGCYAVQVGTEDGFASAPARTSTEIVTLSTYHSADSTRDGKIGLMELTRVIELYNTRSGSVRTGQYHAEAGTEDGFAPGP